MILWKSEEAIEQRNDYIITWRSVLELIIENGIDLSWGPQSKVNYGDWLGDHTDNTGFQINTNWKWGEYHTYYDGCHCFYSIGFIHFRWNNPDCEKCHAER